MGQFSKESREQGGGGDGGHCEVAVRQVGDQEVEAGLGQGQVAGCKGGR